MLRPSFEEFEKIGYSVGATQERTSLWPRYQHPPCPLERRGGGAYNRNSRVQAIALSPAVLMMERAAGVVAVPPE
jgi:hypothetical protein